MARYTDIDKLIAEYDRVHVGPAGGARKLMVEAPIADVVEVVRCKDCKHKVRTSDGEYNPEDIVCDYHMSDGFDENDYCSYGERSEMKGGDHK